MTRERGSPAARRRVARGPAAGDPGRPSDAAAPLVLALPKGRVLAEATALLSRAGFDMSPLEAADRRLVIDCGELRILVLRSQDVPTYVDHGAADVGVAGRDVLDEEGLDLYEPLDLGIGGCRLVVAEPIAQPVDERSQIHLRVATKYPAITRRHLQARGLTAEVIKLYGSVEIGPATGLSDRIVDLVDTGETLRQNGLREIETIMQVTSRLVVNPASLRLRAAAVNDLIERLAAVCAAPRAPSRSRGGRLEKRSIARP